MEQLQRHGGLHAHGCRPSCMVVGGAGMDVQWGWARGEERRHLDVGPRGAVFDDREEGVMLRWLPRHAQEVGGYSKE